ncbi:MULTISPECIES: hypothetical protein [Klebsiella]|uniref:Uncharacterized protein n=3 Tax=Klebsiella TaxID=570 RepID=A0A6N2XW08_KLEOX|nr:MULTISPECIES: hypothetical protein [Klebsiella]EKU4917665.1 hypothetical protein [Klebsiella pneumoniae]EKU4920647.1 hypothetical protein [Klebsiella pneumoniae]QVR36939.1 hypothetical protein KI678_06025 [Klebsiella pneumoniae]TYY45813.1 hypothetical protein FCH00_020135 [Klebsiella pneumoniae]STR20914.1 Uncharacterised protein [Klebsiella oxytoca]
MSTDKINKKTIFPKKNIGVTETERKLSAICDKTFLKLWSWTSLYNDEGIKKNGKGKEICDLLVYYSNTVIIFSDKEIIYTENSEKNTPEEDGTSVAWKRWKRRAVESSVKQIEGAENWIRTHYDRIYFTERCLSSEKFPFINSENINQLKIYRVAIANGCQYPLYLGNGVHDGIITNCRDRHGNYIHVFDSSTIEALTQDLSTVNEFVRYLEEKERVAREGFFTNYDKLIELDLLATYILSPSATRDPGLYFKEEGFKIESFNELNSANDYFVGKQEDQFSIIFDDFIECVSDQFIKGEVICTGLTKFEANQKVLEVLCDFDRLTRRELSKGIIAKFKETLGRAISSRSILLGGNDLSYTRNSIFAVVIFPKAVCKKMNKVEYEKERRLVAEAYAIYYQQKISMDREIVVAAFDNISESPVMWDTNYRSFMARVYKKDFALVYREKKNFTKQEINLFHEIQDRWGILKSSPINSFRGRAYQFHD